MPKSKLLQRLVVYKEARNLFKKAATAVRDLHRGRVDKALEVAKGIKERQKTQQVKLGLPVELTEDSKISRTLEILETVGVEVKKGIRLGSLESENNHYESQTQLVQRIKI